MSRKDLPPMVWGERRGMWGRTPGERVKMVLLLVWMFSGPLLGLVAIRRYPFLDDRTFNAWLIGTPFLFPFTYLITRIKSFPVGVPLPTRIAAAAGWALCLSFLVVGVIGIANGYGSPVETRDVQCVGKRMTRQRSESRRTYYLEVKAWPPSDRVVEIVAPREVWNWAAAGAAVRLRVGRGRLGLEWLSDVSIPTPASETSGARKTP